MFDSEGNPQLPILKMKRIEKAKKTLSSIGPCQQLPSIDRTVLPCRCAVKSRKRRRVERMNSIYLHRHVSFEIPVNTVKT